MAKSPLKGKLKLWGIVEADETWIGGRVRGKGRAYAGKKDNIAK